MKIEGGARLLSYLKGFLRTKKAIILLCISSTMIWKFVIAPYDRKGTSDPKRKKHKWFLDPRRLKYGIPEDRTC